MSIIYTNGMGTWKEEGRDNITDIAIVDNEDDWIGLYINGRLVLEGHELNLYAVLGLLKIQYEKILPDYDWLYEQGTLPEDIMEVQRQE